MKLTLIFFLPHSYVRNDRFYYKKNLSLLSYLCGYKITKRIYEFEGKPLVKY